jgi:hypothetical protein
VSKNQPDPDADAAAARRLAEALDPSAIDALLADAKAAGTPIDGVDGLLNQMTKAVLERALQAEMTHHLGYERDDPAGHGTGNSRNGSSAKTVSTTNGPVTITVPRDRNGEFEPQIVPKRRRRVGQIDELVLSCYARGMSTRDIEAHLLEVYGVKASRELISNVTDVVTDEIEIWRNRPVDEVYPIVYIDGIRIKVRDKGAVTIKVAHLVIGVDVDGRKHALGCWIAEAEGAKFWHAVLTQLRNRGLRDVLIACCDGLTGLPDAITTVFPQTVVQTSSVHHDQAGKIPVITCTVSGRTYADASPSRSRCRPVRSRRWRASHRSAGAAPASGWSAEMRFRRGRPRRGDQAHKEQHWPTSPPPAATRPRRRARCSPVSIGAVRSTRSV